MTVIVRWLTNKKLNPGRHYWSCGTWQINSCESNIGCSGISLSIFFFLYICFVCRGVDDRVYIVYMSFLVHGVLELFFAIDPFRCRWFVSSRKEVFTHYLKCYILFNPNSVSYEASEIWITIDLWSFVNFNIWILFCHRWGL